MASYTGCLSTASILEKINCFIMVMHYSCCSELSPHKDTHNHIEGLVQERCNSSALAMELRLSCTNPGNPSILPSRMSTVVSMSTSSWENWPRYYEITPYRVKCERYSSSALKLYVYEWFTSMYMLNFLPQNISKFPSWENFIHWAPKKSYIFYYWYQ